MWKMLFALALPKIMLVTIFPRGQAVSIPYSENSLGLIARFEHLTLVAIILASLAGNTHQDV